MHIATLIIGFVLSVLSLPAQTVFREGSHEDSIYQQMKKDDTVWGTNLPKGKAQQLLLLKLPLDSVALLLQDQSYIVRYRAFCRMLQLNDDTAFAFLSASIRDTTPIVSFVSCMIDEDPFNDLLLRMYADAVYIKHNYRGGTAGGWTYWSGKIDHKTSRKKFAAFKKLLAEKYQPLFGESQFMRKGYFKKRWT